MVMYNCPMPVYQAVRQAVRDHLRVRISLGVGIPLLLILLVFTGIEYQYRKQVLLDDLSLLASFSGQVIENNLRQQMLANDFDSIQKLLDSIGENEDFRVIYLLNTAGQVIFAPRGEGVGQQLDKTRPDCHPCHSLPEPDELKSVVVQTSEGENVFRSMNPIKNDPACAQCHDPRQRLIGLLLIDISTASLGESLNRSLRESLLWSVAPLLVVLGVVNFGLNHFILSRLEKFAALIRNISVDQALPRLPVQHADELDRLALAFNRMAEQEETHRHENIALSNDLRQQNLLRGELLKRLISAQEDERQRVARELHDEMGQSLSGLSLQIGAAQRLLLSDPPRAGEQLEQLRELVQEASDQMHDMILALRPSVLDDLGLAAALRSQAERLFEHTDIRFTLDASQLQGRLPPEVETALYRVFQEALNNSLRHSHASQVKMALAKTETAFEGQYHDNGQGFDAAQIHENVESGRGFGLLGMQERITQCGGRLEIQSAPGEGTNLFIYIPLDDCHD